MITGDSVSRGLHDCLYLLQVVDVERPDAVPALSRLVQKLAHRNQCHVSNLRHRSKYQSPSANIATETASIDAFTLRTKIAVSKSAFQHFRKNKKLTC